MNKKLYKDLDENVYSSLSKILNYDKRLILLSHKRRNVLLEELERISKEDNVRLVNSTFSV